MTAPLEYKHMPATFDPDTMQVYVLGVPLSRGSVVVRCVICPHRDLIDGLHLAGYKVHIGVCDRHNLVLGHDTNVGSRYALPADLNNL